MSNNNSITHDPIYYVTVGFFALLNTALPAALGQPRFLPIIQTISLFVFVAVALHHRNVSGAIKVMAIWLPIQFVAIALLTSIFPAQVEAAFTAGFAYRGAISYWFFGGAPHPATMTTEPVAYFAGLAVTLLGSLITAGLAGIWILVRIVNQSAYGAGVLLSLLENPGQALLVVPYWTLLRAAAHAGLVVLLAQPLLTGTWSPGYYWRNQQRLVQVTFLLLVLALLAELVLPGLVARTPVI